MAIEDQLRSRLVAELDDQKAQLSRIYEDALAEERDVSATEDEQVVQRQARIEELGKQIARIDEVKATREAVMDIQHATVRAEVQRKQERATGSITTQDRMPQLGDFVDSDAYRNWGGGGRSATFQVQTRATDLRATITEGSAPGSLLLPTNPRFQVPQPGFDTPLLNAVGRLQVSTNAVDMVVYGSPTGATGFAEVAEGALKPEAAITASTQTINLSTKAAWVAATRQLLDDAPAARGLIDGQLRRGLLNKMESDTAASIDGATIAPTTGASKQSLLEVARIGMATVQTAGFRPNAIVCSPLDAANFDLALYGKTLGGAAAGASTWGLQVIPVAGLTGVYLGDFQTGVTFIERVGIQVFIGEPNDSFLRNQFVILAEARYKPVVTQPAALTKLVVTA